MQRPHVTAKLLKIFLLQIGLISAVTAVGIYSAALVAEDLLVNQALQGEADYFWQRYRTDNQSTLPNSLNLMGYLGDPAQPEQTPVWLRGLSAGMHRISHQGMRPIVHVSQQQDRILYLVFDEEQVSRLSFLFGIAPLTAVLLVLYVLAFLGYFQAKRAISPIVKVAQRVQETRFDERGLQALDFADLRRNADMETDALVDAMESLMERLAQFVVRERNFTRYASHELRTPLAVIKGSVANLQHQHQDEKSQRALQRMATTVTHMETLLETLLLLAREDNMQQDAEPICVNDMAALVLDQLRLSQPRSDLTLEQKNIDFLQVQAPQKLVGIVLTNLIRNALSYTLQGSVRVHIDREGFSVEDTGIGIAPQDIEHIFDPFYRGQNYRNQEKGYGLGLSIVHKICRQLGWKIDVQSEENKGSCFRVQVSPLTAQV